MGTLAFSFHASVDTVDHHFLWRLAHNSHPMYMNIARRGVELDTRCAVCGRLFEDGGHLFLNCKWVKQRWRALQLEDVRLQLIQLQTAREVVYAVLRLPDEQRMLTIALLWSWLSERNRGNHGERRATTEEFQFSVRFHVNEWKQYLDPAPTSQVASPRVWQPPPPDQVKINIDGAYTAETGRGGWGLVCRDSHNDILFAAAGSSGSLSLTHCMLKLWLWYMLSTLLISWGLAELCSKRIAVCSSMP